MADRDIPEAPTTAAKPRRPSPIWLVPIFAAVLAGAVAFNAASEQGPLVEIRFRSAGGVEAGKTHVRYKDVVVGEVEEVSFSDDLEHVVVHARLDKSMAPYVGDTTQFWIVSARVNGAQISGLNTLLSGAYLEMDWTEKPSRRLRVIDGLASPPLTEPGTPGRRVTLVSDRGGALSVGSEVSYKQLPAGRIETRELSEDGRTVTFTAFITAPYDNFLTTESRFWNVSGLDIEAGSEGLLVNVESLSALVSGGVAFGDLDDRVGEPIEEDGVSFSVFPNQGAARESLFKFEGQEQFRFIVEFSESVGGLKAGAPIQFEGITIGRVVDVVAEVDREVVGPPRVYAVLQLEPNRLTKDAVDPDEFKLVLNALVASGMRLQLVMGNPLSGSLSVQMIQVPDAEPAAVDFSVEPYPALPTAPSEITALARNVEDLLASLAGLPLNDLVLAATALLQQTERLLSDPSMTALPGEVSELAQVLAAFSLQAEGTLQGLTPDSELYIELTAATAELRDAARSVARLAERLEEQPNSLITGRN
ncbi:MAG: MlaD family protein [Pseudomonadota bacterium]